MEDDTEKQGKGIVKQHLDPYRMMVDGRVGAVDEPFANNVAEHATGAAVGHAGKNGRPERVRGVPCICCLISAGEMAFARWRMHTVLPSILRVAVNPAVASGMPTSLSTAVLSTPSCSCVVRGLSWRRWSSIPVVEPSAKGTQVSSCDRVHRYPTHSGQLLHRGEEALT